MRRLYCFLRGHRWGPACMREVRDYWTHWLAVLVVSRRCERCGNWKETP